MPILRVKEIRDMPSEERTKRLNELRTELLRLKTMIKAGGTVENPARIKELRKTIARIMTIEHEQKHGLTKEKTNGKKDR
jgi:large subunit ribosomal protein L29